jgi:hypothetical protein
LSKLNSGLQCRYNYINSGQGASYGKWAVIIIGQKQTGTDKASIPIRKVIEAIKTSGKIEVAKKVQT